jgi:hypothetical protein
MDKSSSGNTQDADVSVPGAGADTSAPPADRPPNYQVSRLAGYTPLSYCTGGVDCV